MAGFGTDLIPGLIAGKPKIPDWNTISLGGEQAKAIDQNTKQLPALESLAGQYNQFTTDQMVKLMGQVIPDFEGMKSGITKNIDSMLKGELPLDVVNSIHSDAAAAALTGGFAGTGMAGNLVAKDIGTNSLNLISKGISTAQSWISQMGSMLQPQLFNMSSMFVSPQQQFEDTFQNQEAQFQRDYTSNMNDYEHSFKKLLATDVQGTANTLLSYFGGSMMGGGGGGMGGGGGGGGSQIPASQQSRIMQEGGFQ